MTKTRAKTHPAPDNSKDILMSVGMCPGCGSLQITIPTDSSGNVVTTGMDHEHARSFVVALIELFMRYNKGTLGDGGHLPVKCCPETTARPH